MTLCECVNYEERKEHLSFLFQATAMSQKASQPKFKANSELRHITQYQNISLMDKKSVHVIKY